MSSSQISHAFQPHTNGATRILSSAVDEHLQNGAVLLTANRRLARSFTSAYQAGRLQAGLQSWVSPEIQPLETWLRVLYEGMLVTGVVSDVLITNEQAQLLWRRVIEDHGETLLQPGSAASLARDAWQTARAFQFESSRSWPTNDDQEIFRQWLVGYQTLLENEGFMDDALLPDVLGQHCSLLHRLPTTVMLAGFQQLTPQRLHLFQAMEAQGTEIIVLGHDNSEVPLSQFGGGIIPPVDPSDTHAWQVPCADPTCELQMLANWARQQLESSPEQAIGIVIPDLHQQRSTVLDVFDNVFFAGATPLESVNRPYELSLGVSLAEVAPVRDALLTLRLVIDRLDQHELSRLLLSPYVKDADRERHARANADIRLRQKGVTGLGLRRADWRRVGLPDSFRKCLEKAVDSVVGFAESADKQSEQPKRWIRFSMRLLPSQWQPLFEELLDAFGWPGRGVTSHEHQAVESFRDLVSRMGSLDRYMGEVKISNLLVALQQQAQERVFQPESSHQPIQILGMLESLGLTFDKLWITGLHAGAWPVKTHASPFLPMAWQVEAGAPGAHPDADRELAEARLRQWFASAPEVYCSFPELVDGAETQASPQIQALPLYQPDSDSCISQIAPESDSQSAIETIEDSHGIALAAGAAVKGGAKLFEDQAECPFRSYVYHRLQVRAVEDPEAGLDPRDKGNLFHAALQFFWEQVGSQENLLALSEGALSSAIDDAVEKGLSTLSPFNAFRRDQLEVERFRLKKLITEWLTVHETARAAFNVDSMEDEEEHEFGGLKLRLKIDRVDQLESGGYAVIDYKTGKSNSTRSWTEQRITSPQLPLYALLRDDVRLVAFAQLAANNQKYIGIAEDDELINTVNTTEHDDGWEGLKSHWQLCLGELADEVRQGLATVTPVKTACNFCDLKPVCRINREDNDADETSGSVEIGS